MKESRSRGREKGERIQVERQLTQKELRDRRALERHKKMIESRTSEEGTGANIRTTGGTDSTTGLPSGS